MKRRCQKLFLAKLIIFNIIILFFCKVSLAQRKPNMWVDSLSSQIRVASYNLKHFLLTNYLKTTGVNKTETDSIFFPINSFTNMINYFKNTLHGYTYLSVFIASYDRDGTIAVPAGMGNLLTLVFVPQDDSKNDLGYYTIPPGGNFDPNSQNCNLTRDIFNKWANVNYQTGKMPTLLQTISNINDNQDDQGVFSDTRMIRYPALFIQQLLDEIIFQATNGPNGIGVTVSGVRAFFASYTAHGNPDEGGRFPNRLIVQFEFTKKVGNDDAVFYLERTPGWQNRPAKLSVADIGKEKNVNLKGLDNGQLCPPYNCPR